MDGHRGMTDNDWDVWPAPQTKPQPYEFDRDAHEAEVQQWIEHYRKEREA